MIFVDSSVLVAAAHENHPHFNLSHAFLTGLRKGEAGLAAHGAVETYAVLTCLPKSFAFSESEASAYIARLTERKLQVFDLARSEVIALIAEAPTRRVSGGRIYDAIQARTAAKAGAAALVTWNVKHFHGLEPSVEAITPEKATRG